MTRNQHLKELLHTNIDNTMAAIDIDATEFWLVGTAGDAKIYARFDEFTDELVEISIDGGTTVIYSIDELLEFASNEVIDWIR